VVGALSLAAAVLIDPAARTDALPATLTVGEATDDGGAPLDATSGDQSDAASIDAASTDAGEEDGGPVVVEVPPPPPPPSDSPDSLRTRLSFELGAGATTAIEGIDSTLGLGVGLRRTRGASSLWALRAIAFASLGGEVSAAEGTIAYRAYGARLDACPFVGRISALLSLDACAFGALWLVPVNAPDARIDHPQTRVFATPGLVGRATAARGAFALAFDLGAGVHPVSERFRIEPGGEVFRLQPVYGFAGIGVVLTTP
jgi:hypothetical protein